MESKTKVKKLNRIGPYIKLQTKLAFTPSKQRSKWRSIGLILIGTIIFVAALYLLFYFFRSLCNQAAEKYISKRDIPILFFTIDELFILIYCIVSQVKRMFNPENPEILLTLPVTNFEKYIGELVTILIKIAIYNFVLFYPIVLIYGFASNIIDVTYAFTSMFSVIFLPLLPFGISILFAIPIIYLAKVLKNREVIKFILFLVLFIGILVLYCILLVFLADGFTHLRYDKQILETISNFLKNMKKWYNPAFYATVISLNWKVGYAFLIHISAAIVFAVVGSLGSYPIFKHFSILDDIESSSSKKIVKFDNKNIYKATFAKDFKQIFRTPSYAYFFLGVAICMPILTYLTTDLIKTLGEVEVGPETFFGLSLLSLMIIVSLIGSYSANTLSREQNQFYLSKIAPVNVRKYLVTKVLVTFTIAFAGLAMCTAVLAATSMRKQTVSSLAVLTPTNIIVIFGVCLLFLIGLCFNGLNLNLSRPTINTKGNVNESNIAILLAIGIFISLVISLLSTIFSALSGKQTVALYVTVLVLPFIYAAINFTVFMLTAKKRFAKIEIS